MSVCSRTSPQDWRLRDPKVLPTEEVRIIRDEVKKRVEDLLGFDGLVDLP